MRRSEGGRWKSAYKVTRSRPTQLHARFCSRAAGATSPLRQLKSRFAASEEAICVEAIVN